MNEDWSKRLKVLLGCYACDPYRGSEPGTGWNFVITIARYHDVHVIVRDGDFQRDIEKFSKENPEQVKNITFHFIPATYHAILRKIWPPSFYWFYHSWQKKAYEYAVELDKKENFDIVHHVNMVGYREPGLLWKLNKPFIWGPVGGFKNTAWSLLFSMDIHNFVFFSCRNIINAYQKRFSLAARHVSKIAHTIFASDDLVLREIQSLWKREAVLMREVGTKKNDDHPDICNHLPGTPLKVCWVGLFVPLKALPILIRAISLCRTSVQVEVLGGGGEEKKWKKLVKDLHLEHCIRFHGLVPHKEVSSIMKQCHVMCITSIHEGGTPTVTMEALQNGLPFVALDHCGYSTVINETCGIKIPIQSIKKISESLARELDRLALDEELRLRLANGALERSKDFTWDAKAEIINRVYAEAHAQSAHTI
ncbi:MAG: glycosyltransferase family 4 protein [Akkermansia sp.]|nr:glycosyltransferase family 4 protein [Akkermansia sp.]